MAKGDKPYDFPDTLPSEEIGWATFVPERKPQFKVHNTKGLAHSALGQRNYYESYALYELVGGIWHRRFEYVPGSDCNYCGNEFSKDQWGGYVRIRPLSDGPGWNKKPICNKCYTVQREQRNREIREAQERAELARLQAIYN